MPKPYSAIFVLFVILFAPFSIWAQDGEGLSADTLRAGNTSEDLSEEVEELKTKLDNLIDAAQIYTIENKRLNSENENLRSELNRINRELSSTRKEADDLSGRFSNSLTNSDQRGGPIGLYDENSRRDNSEVCQDTWGNSDVWGPESTYFECGVTKERARDYYDTITSQ